MININDIKIGSVVKLLYWKDKKVHDFTVNDIYFERYISDFKTIVRAKYYSEVTESWHTETFFSNDFFKAWKDAMKKETSFNDYLAEQMKDPEFREEYMKAAEEIKIRGEES